MRRALLYLAAIALLAAPARAQFDPSGNGWKAIDENKFGGLNLLNDSTAVGNDCQNCQNVLTDSGYLEKRPGSVLLATILPGYTVQYVNDWVAPSGSRYLIAQASNTVYQTNFSGAPIALSTISAGYNLNTVPAFSRLEFADGFRPLWFWDSNSTGTVNDIASGILAPTCTYIAYKDARIWCANLPAEGSSRVRVSSAGGDGYYVVPANFNTVDGASNVWDLNPNDGDSINCMAATPWGMFVAKRYSSYMIKGNGNLSYDPRLLDPKIGCVDNRSVQMVYGVLEWLAVDGVYAYNGTGPPQLISRELDPLMKLVRQSTYADGQWATQLQPDWQSGTVSMPTGGLPTRGSWDFQSQAGEVFPSSFTLFDDNTNPALQTNGSVGFSSDTLVFMDTTTYPLSVGAVQVAPSSTGVNVWSDYFAGGVYTAGPTSWTITSGAMNSIAPNGIQGSNPGLNTIYTMLSPTELPRNYGFWEVAWSNSAPTFSCATNGVSTCLEYQFMSNKPPDAPDTSSGYGIDIIGDLATAANTTLNLYKDFVGVRTVLATAIIDSTPCTLTSGGCVFGISRTVSGAMSVTEYNPTTLSTTTLIAGANDNSLASVPNIGLITSLALGRGSIFNQQNTVFWTSLSGYGKGTIISRIYDSGMVVPLAGALSSSYTLTGVAGETEIDFFLRSSTSPNNDDWSSWQASSNSVHVTGLNRYWQYAAKFYTNVSSETALLGTVQLVSVTTGYYYSKVNFIGSGITSWKQFATTEQNPGTYNYWVRQATYAFSPALTGIPWVAQTDNQNVNLGVSTPTYAQYRLDSTNLTTADAAEPISAVFLRWAVGANIPVASASLERRYFLCVAISTSVSVPDTCLIRQKTAKWVYYQTNTLTSAMGMYNYNIVQAAGDTSSKVFEIMQPGVYEDAGAPIDAIWVTADYDDNLIFNNKQWFEFWVDALPVQGSSVTLSYQVNKSTGYNDYQFSLDNGQGINPTILAIPNGQYGSINLRVPIAAGYDQGKYIRLKFEDSTLDSYYRINEFLIYYLPQSRQLTSQ